MKIFVYPDPACRQRKTSAGGRTDLTILQNAGFNVKCKLKHSPVRDRINAVNSRLKSAILEVLSSNTFGVTKIINSLLSLEATFSSLYSCNLLIYFICDMVIASKI